MANVHGYGNNTFDASEETKTYHDGDTTDAVVVSDEHHQLHRGLKSRQVAMIAIGGAVGTGS